MGTRPWYRRKWLIAVGIVILPLVWLQLQVPSNDGLWHEAQGRTAWVEFSGRAFTVHNVRDFRYGADRRVVSFDYREQSYNLDNLQRGWWHIHF